MKDYTKELGFWKRLENFIKDVTVSDYPGQEEKDMILYVCELKILDLQNVSVSKRTVCDHNAMECHFHTPKTHICYYKATCKHQQTER